MADLPSICFVIPYFGKWPFWINYYLESCRYNPTVNWLIYTDCGVPVNCPPNLKIVEISYVDYCKKISDRLGIEFLPNNPYKLCDVKPALGYIHGQELAGYDFWAFGDIDLVYGNLRHYFTTQRLKTKDIFSTHNRRISGHLCLLRNTEQTRLAFMQVSGWEKLLAANEHVAFDECAFSKLFLRHKNSPAWAKSLACLLDPKLKVGEFQESFNTPNAKIAWIDGTMNFPKKWCWNQGTLTNDINAEREFPYFHFMAWKNGQHFNANNPLLIQEPSSYNLRFSISESGFKIA